MKKTTLTNSYIRKLVLEEAKKMSGFGKMRDTSSVKAKEVEPDELASTLENHEDFTVAEQAIAQAKKLRLEESRLIKRIKEIRSQRAAIATKLSKLV
jgi:hypothetical protein